MKSRAVNILGISAFYHDSAIALLQNGEILFAAQEERYTRIKADASFPMNALKDGLKQTKLKITDIDYIIFYENPADKYQRILKSCIEAAPGSLNIFLRGVCPWMTGKASQHELIQASIKSGLNLSPLIELPPIFCTQHHLSHAASAFYPSPYSEAAILCVDGVGESETMTIWHGQGTKITKIFDINYPDSLGLLYSSFTQYTGFAVNSGEYKLMGLAPYGKPLYKNLITKYLIDIKEDGAFKLNMDYFSYQSGKRMINHKFEKLFGERARQPDEKIRQLDMDIASSIQAVFNELLLKLARRIHGELGVDNLCLAGGVALNCVANGYIKAHGPFKNIWVQPSAGDAGGALGAAYVLWYEYLNNERQVNAVSDSMHGGYLGPSYTDHEIEEYLSSVNANYTKLAPKVLYEKTADKLANDNVVGWFQGRMEFGPRALGHRSILGDPRSANMQTTMNLKIKYRESFRPFAPSVMAEHAREYFDIDHESPYMLFVRKVNEQHRVERSKAQENITGLAQLSLARSSISAVTHVDYSARIQTVTKDRNPIYHALLSAFNEKTGCPILVNTSFNVRGEPIVCTPQDAYECFMNTEMDHLVINTYFLSKVNQPTENQVAKEFKPD